MNFYLVSQGLKNAEKYLQKITQINNSVIFAADKAVGWGNRKKGIFKGVYYPLEYQALIDSQQYSFLLSDGSFFQFYYEFSLDKEDELKMARLAFYPKPISTKDTTDEIIEEAEKALDREDDDLYEHLYNWNELMELHSKLPTNTSHIRFDYDPKAETHSKAHLQFGGVQDFRMAANFCPLPLAFIGFCHSLLTNIDSLEAEHVAFEKKNSMRLDKVSEIVRLELIE